MARFQQIPRRSLFTVCQISGLAACAAPADKHAEIDEAFEHVEHEETGAGVHEKYLALAEKLEAIANQ